MMAARVSDLPAPDSPTIPSTSPAPIAKEMPSTAVTVPRRVAKPMRRSSTPSRDRRVTALSDTLAAGNRSVDTPSRIAAVIETTDDQTTQPHQSPNQPPPAHHHP